MIVRTQQPLDVFDRNPALCMTNERKFLFFRTIWQFGIEILLDVPGPRIIITRILDRRAAKDVAEVVFVMIRIKVMLFDQFLKTRRRQRVIRIKIKFVNVRSVWSNDVCIIRNSDGCPLMTAVCFQIPDFILIGKSNPVHLIRSVFFKNRTQTQDAFFCRMNVRQNKRQHVFFTDSVFNQRIDAQNPRIGRNRFSCRHCDVFAVDSGFAPNTLVTDRIRSARITQCFTLGRKRNLDLAQFGLIRARLIFRLNDNELLRACPETAIFIS